ncbi:PTS sugar transporter subunit IIB [Eubacterium multiforme]|uniref:PTS system cellobiose-specific IIB component n=1 Tax=Eubacterium multiforme TaxID=83339 RepID=A0ABT9UXQ9_9FIRM|nr:PTS sugar transporter subunit IIB [Eubacterium multiforme]MDQ0151088.1 PTS system cellobiose-specific IIB component [Eubacterium multiforme]
MRIMLVCAGGMSTSILVLKMQEACKKQNIKNEIWAIDYCSIKRYVGKVDIVLIAPQIANYISDIQHIMKKETKVYKIEEQAYGLMNGEKILESAMKKYEMEKDCE